jgi:glycosyltransferase involved in cell wall biosynthesis
MKLVIQNTAHVWGGNEKMLATLAQGLDMRGHDVVISCARGVVTQGLRAMNLRTSHFRPRGALDPASGLSFALWLRRQRPDALLITSWGAMSWAALGGRIAGVRRTVLRQGIVRSAPSRGIKRYAVNRWIDDVITNAPEIRQRWIETAPSFPPGRVHVVLNSVSPLAHRRGELRKALRAELGLPDDVLLVGAAGIVARRKGFDLLMEAAAAIGDPRVHVALIGDGPHRAELENLSRDVNLTGTIHFLGHREMAAEAIAGLDVFVLSSHNEGMANVMLEAMSAGVPVVASEISGVTTALTPDQARPAGWTFSAGDSESLAAVLRNVMDLVRSQSEEVKARTEEALSRIKTRFSLERMLDESERILFG